MAYLGAIGRLFLALVDYSLAFLEYIALVGYICLEHVRSILVKLLPVIANFLSGFLGVIARNFEANIGNGVMLLYPLCATMRAIWSPSTLEDKQWLTYWALYAFMTLFELSCWKILQWLPFWPYMKLALCLWLVLPFFNGARYVYGNFVRVDDKLATYAEKEAKKQQ